MWESLFISYICFIDLCICPNTSTTLYWLLQLCNKCWNWEVWFFQLCSIFQDDFGCSGYLQFRFNMNFLVSLSISENKSTGILVEIALNLQINLGSMTILTTLRLLTHKHRVSFYILFVSTMFVVFRVYWFYPFWQVKFTSKYFTTLRL